MSEGRIVLDRRELNVLRRLLGRAEFQPREIADLGLARLQSAPGLGAKGLQKVLAWLAAEGFPLQLASRADSPARHERVHRRIENARHLLEQWGWQVRRADGEDGVAQHFTESK